MGFLDRLFGRRGVPADAAADGEPVAARAEAATVPPPEEVPASEDSDDAAAPGWDAISAAFAALYPDQASPQHYGTLISWRLGGGDPLDGISVYRGTRPVPHWHYVTYGLSDLYGEDLGGEESGYGFELTFRLADPAAADADAEAPRWPLSLLQNVARYVFETGNILRAGEHMNANGPIALDEDTALTALLFQADPLAGEIDTPSGTVRFTQMLGITAADLVDVQQWRGASFAELLAERDGHVTDLSAGSLRDDAALAARIDAGQAQEGSSVGYLYVDPVAVEADAGGFTVSVAASAAGAIARTMTSRLAQGRDVRLLGNAATVLLAPVDAPTAPVMAGDDLTVSLTPEQQAALASGVQAGAETVEIPGASFVLRVLP